ncbi:MAG: DNA-binding protein WhiA [Erysipelotrichaceae bacterium]|nr:DNA-binding protein WhiA [Erysipelotrichaceae bacterium]
MSFTSEIKQELCYNELKDCCNKAELCGLIEMTSSLSIDNRKWSLVARSENPTTAKRIFSLIRKCYSADVELIMAQKTNLRKNNVYTIKINEDPINLLTDLGLYSSKGFLTHPSYTVVQKDCCARAYMAGIFLAYGSCNSPSKSNYHLEISLSDEDQANFAIKILSRFNIIAKVTKRRGRYVVYIKKADLISDFLRMIGAQESLMNFENTRINRDFMNSWVRLDNCEIANEVKSISAARKQVEYMKKIMDSGKYNTLDDKLRAVIDLRMAHPESSLLELCDHYQKKHGVNISKSGLKHRLNKIEAIAKELS